MRQLAVVALFVLAGCTAQGLPIDNSPGSGGTGGGGTTHGGTVDMARQLGGMGGKCTTACDCEPGLACRMGTCGQSPIGMVYCCDADPCPAGNICQSSGGSFAQCGSGNGGGNGGPGGGNGGGPGGGNGGGGGFGGGGGPSSDLGLGMFCKQVPCGGANGDFCKQLGCGACTAAGVCGN